MSNTNDPKILALCSHLGIDADAPVYGTPGIEDRYPTREGAEEANPGCVILEYDDCILDYYGSPVDDDNPDGYCECIGANGGVYEVLDGDEYEQRKDDVLEQYLDDCVLCDIPAPLQCYFDRDAWKHDVDANGEADNLVDRYGEGVAEAYIDGEWYYIIRVD